MTQPLFDFDLKRVSRTHYITGKAAINFPHAGSTTGGWHFLSYFDRDSGVAKVSMAVLLPKFNVQPAPRPFINF
ncbi:hypothetical protein [Pseudomonas fragi]|uniref:hypothetical protein n=1 Tax=Pseudomonas fragi TaxID=296 RepID=UPI000BA23D5A|nr:hypothetical protein [Pseudomonas fragi]PAA23973.1 hypothetical protein CJU77_05895 [Pseudomonas fragi]